MGKLTCIIPPEGILWAAVNLIVIVVVAPTTYEVETRDVYVKEPYVAVSVIPEASVSSIDPEESKVKKLKVEVAVVDVGFVIAETMLI